MFKHMYIILIFLKKSTDTIGYNSILKINVCLNILLSDKNIRTGGSLPKKGCICCQLSGPPQWDQSHGYHGLKGPMGPGRSDRKWCFSLSHLPSLQWYLGDSKWREGYFHSLLSLVSHLHFTATFNNLFFFNSEVKSHPLEASATAHMPHTWKRVLFPPRCVQGVCMLPAASDGTGGSSLGLHIGSGCQCAHNSCLKGEGWEKRDSSPLHPLPGILQTGSLC